MSMYPHQVFLGGDNADDEQRVRRAIREMIAEHEHLGDEDDPFPGSEIAQRAGVSVERCDRALDRLGGRVERDQN